MQRVSLIGPVRPDQRSVTKLRRKGDQRVLAHGKGMIADHKLHIAAEHIDDFIKGMGMHGIGVRALHGRLVREFAPGRGDVGNPQRGAGKILPGGGHRDAGGHGGRAGICGHGGSLLPSGLIIH